jgi:hypothetical protein
MKNIAQYENFLSGSPMNERLERNSVNLIQDVAAQMGVDPEELKRMVELDLAEEGLDESRINESIVGMTAFFIIFPSLVAGLVSLSLGSMYLEGRATNKRWIKAEAEQRVKEMIKKDPSLIDRQEELVIKVAEEIKNDPKIQDMLKKSKWEGGKQHPSIKKDRSYYRTHIFGGGY